MLGKLDIASKIKFGFFFKTAIIALVAGFVIYEVNRLAASLGEFRAIAAKTVALGAFSENVAATRTAAMRYRLAPHPDAIAAVEASVERVEADAAAAARAFADAPAKRSLLQALAAQIDAYRSEFQSLTSLRARLDALEAERAEISADLAAALASAPASPALAEARRLVMAAQFETERFARLRSLEASEAAQAATAQAIAAARRITGPAGRQAVQELQRHQETMAAIGAAEAQAEAIASDRLDAIGPQVRAALGGLIAETIAEEKALSAALGERVALTTTIIVIVGVGGALLGLALSLILPRTLRGLTALTQVVGAIARKEDDVAVPGLERSDEVGALARALKEISASGAEAARVAAAVAASDTPIALIDVNERIIYANDRFEALAAANPAAFAALTPQDAEGRDAAPLLKAVDTAIDDGDTRVQHNGAEQAEISV
ncbi:MAG: hypothetical protein AAGM38_14295, partial [Pseudomonadota bacterium]